MYVGPVERQWMSRRGGGCVCSMHPSVVPEGLGSECKGALSLLAGSDPLSEMFQPTPGNSACLAAWESSCFSSLSVH